MIEIHGIKAPHNVYQRVMKKCPSKFFKRAMQPSMLVMIPTESTTQTQPTMLYALNASSTPQSAEENVCLPAIL